MIITDLKSKINGGKKRICARVQWEDCNRPEYELFYETDEAYSDGFHCNPHAFLTGCIIPAFHYGEQRISIREEICPELLEGIGSILRFFRSWYYTPDKKIVTVEAKSLSKYSNHVTNPRSGVFFSGGIDSFATVCANRRNYNGNHPRSIKDGFIAFGLEQDDIELFDHVLSMVRKFDDKDHFTIIPIYTNVYLNFRDEDAADQFKFWLKEFGGAALASIAHCFSQRVSTVYIASSSHLFDQPWGSHPLIDPKYSSHDMRIIHDDVSLSRLEKTKLVAGWDMALQNLRVCNRYQQYRKEMLNCGECEKCVRTMMELLAVGALDKTGAFPVKDVSPEMVLKNAKKFRDMALSKPLSFVRLKPVYEEIIPELVKINRKDLADAILELINPQGQGLWKSKLIQFDKQYLESLFVKFKRSILSRISDSR